MTTRSNEAAPAWPDAGVHADVPREQYDALAASHYSTLKMVRQSPKHAREYMAHRPKATSAMELGRATHLKVFEPDLFEDEFAVAPAMDRRTKAGKAEWSAFNEAVAGKTILMADEAKQADAIAAAVRSHPTSAEIVEASGPVELSVVWSDETTGQKCKARIDKYTRARGRNAVVDLKTTAKIDDHSIQRQAHAMGYFLQAGWYRHGLDVIQPADRSSVIIWAESQPPFDVRVMWLDDQAVEEGRLEMLALLRAFHEASETGVWAGMGDGVLCLPPWAYKGS